ncbi:MAG: 3-isopropylmalate dehydratase small subunit [Rickettsiales bacterium]
MQPFKTLTSVAAPLPIANIDTDMIIPKQFLKTIKRTGLKDGLFYEMRYTVDGKRIDDFILHQPPFDKAQILIGGINFGCGSSREHAPWALLDFGIRCVIAPSYADIFFNNCFKNGVLPVILPQENIDTLTEYAKTGGAVSVDLEKQIVSAGNHQFGFDVEEFRKHCLLNGLDDIGLTLQKLDAIDNYETKQKERTPWLAA